MALVRKFHHPTKIMAFQACFERWSESSTIHGVRYAFDSKTAYFRRFLWITITFMASFIGIYMSAQMFVDWKEQVTPITVYTMKFI